MRGSERVFGYRPDEMIGNCLEQMHPDDRASTLEMVKRINADKPSVIMKTVLSPQRRPDYSHHGGSAAGLKKSRCG